MTRRMFRLCSFPRPPADTVKMSPPSGELICAPRFPISAGRVSLQGKVEICCHSDTLISCSQQGRHIRVWFVADFQGWCPAGWSDREGCIKVAGDTLIFKLLSSDTKPWNMGFSLWRLPFFMPLLSWGVMKFEQIPLSVLKFSECENPFLPLRLLHLFLH